MEINELKLFLKSLPKLNDKNAPQRLKRAKDDFAFFVSTYLGHHIGLDNAKKHKESSIFRRWVYESLPQLTEFKGKIAKNNDNSLAKGSAASLSYFWGCEVSSERSALGVRERSEKQTPQKELKRQAFSNKICIKAYRGAAKTTLMRLFALWKLLRGDKRYTIFIGSTQDLAKETIDLLKTELEDNANLVMDFGICQGSVWTNEELVFSVGAVPCKIKSFGAGKKIRGTNFLSMRPDLIICDDIENDENIESKTQRDKLYSWFNKAILKLPSRLNKHYNIIIVGTTLHYDSLLQRLDKRDDFKSFNFPLVINFPQNLDEILQNLNKKDEISGEVFSSENPVLEVSSNEIEYANSSRQRETKRRIYAKKTSLKGLKLDDSSLDGVAILTDLAQDRASFFSEFQNLPLDKENAPLAHYTTYTELPRSVESIIIGIDPSLGKTRGDYFALSTLYFTKATKTLYASAQGFKISPEKMIDKIIALYLRVCKVCATITIATEEVAFQEFFKTQLKAKFNALGLFVPIVGIKNTQNKAVRLDALAPLLKDESILIDENAVLLREELDSYPKCAHDDLLDSVEIALRAFNANARADYKHIHQSARHFAPFFKRAKDGF